MEGGRRERIQLIWLNNDFFCWIRSNLILSEQKYGRSKFKIYNFK